MTKSAQAVREIAARLRQTTGASVEFNRCRIGKYKLRVQVGSDSETAAIPAEFEGVEVAVHVGLRPASR
jgi:hypothetical protein